MAGVKRCEDDINLTAKLQDDKVWGIVRFAQQGRPHGAVITHTPPKIVCPLPGPPPSPLATYAARSSPRAV